MSTTMATAMATAMAVGCDWCDVASMATTMATAMSVGCDGLCDVFKRIQKESITAETTRPALMDDEAGY